MDNDVKEFYYQKIREGLEQCTEEQRHFFNRLYPDGIENINEDRLDWILQQVKKLLKRITKRMLVIKTDED